MITLYIFIAEIYPWFGVTLEHFMKNNLNSFTINPLEQNPGKFPSMILGQKDDFKYNLKVRSVVIKEPDEGEPLRITIDETLNPENILKDFIPRPVQISCFRRNQKKLGNR